MLQFIGNGSAFNTKRINNSAFIKKGTDLVLIDCGETVFTALKESGLLDDVKNLRILITHQHPDHIGSLGSLIFYAHFILKIHPIIFSPADNIKPLLDGMGVSEELYSIYRDAKCDISLPAIGFISYEAIDVDHVPQMKSCGYKLCLNGRLAYYSGDSNMIPDQILDDLYSGEIDFFYQDTCSNDYEGNVHLSISRLSKMIRQEHRHKVWCMHLDQAADEETFKELGFNMTQQYED